MMAGLQRLLGTSIRRQLVLGITAVHALLLTLFVLDLVERQRSFLSQQSADQALAIAQNIATTSTPWVLAHDVIGLEEVVQAVSGYPGFKYAFLLSPKGQVLAHSDADRVGHFVTDALSLQSLNSPAESRILYRDGHLIDAVAPILVDGRLVGWSRIALDQKATQASLLEVLQNGIGYTLAAILIGTLFALLMARGLTRPLNRLLAATREIRAGARQLRLHSHRQDELGQLERHFDYMLDALQNKEQELTEAKEQLTLAFNGSQDGWWDWNPQTNEVVFSDQWKAMLGYLEHEIDGDFEEWHSRVHPHDLPQAMADIEAHLAGNTERYENIHRLRHKNGHWVWILDRGIALRGDDGQVHRVVGTHTDISDRVRTEQALSEERERLHVTLGSIADAVISTDARGRIDYFNPAAEKLLQRPMAEVLGQPAKSLFQLRHDRTGEVIENPVSTVLRASNVAFVDSQAELHLSDRCMLHVEYSASPMQDQNGDMIGVVLVIRDVSETRRMAEEMRWQASHDPLTGLYNRRALEHHLQEALEETRDSRSTHAMLYLDLDQFKIINDNHGHLAGDELLRQIAHLLAQHVRKGDLLTRLGGDEFGIILQNCDRECAVETARTLRDAVKGFSGFWQDKVFSVGVSIGVVIIDRSFANMEDVLSAADIACYAAKDEGRNRYRVYAVDDGSAGERHQQMRLVNVIQDALREDLFELHAQEIRPLSEEAHDVRHLELLVRMRSADGGLVSPAEFIPAAERYGLMDDIDQWVIEEAFRQLEEYHRRRPNEAPEVHCAINLSGHSVVSDDTLAFIQERRQHYGLKASTVIFEITETAAITHIGRALNFIQVLRQQGFRFALDDFGTGVSSFSYLKSLPVNYLKIDGSFVRDIARDASDRLFVQSINQVGQTLGLRTIAEFVENREILHILQELGVDMAQGYLLHRPEALRDYLERQRQKHAAYRPSRALLSE